MRIYCCECGDHVISNLVAGKDVYPHRPDLYSLKFYRCDACGNSVGTHKGSKNPLGCIANKEIKNYRSMIHAIIDPIWKSGILKRRVIYKAMSVQFGREFHASSLRTVDECEWALAQAKLLSRTANYYGKDAPSMIEKLGWHKEN